MGRSFHQREPQYEEEGWLMTATLVAEWRRGKPVALVMKWVIPLERNGFLFAGDAEGYGSLYGQIPEIEGLPEQAALEVGNGFGRQIGSALFAISLMHCKNVDVALVDPPERLSRKHEHRHGRPLISYYVLDIKPMRRILDAEGEAQTKGLGHALHICRGHFKTYTDDAPLFGKRVGTYWWESQVRGKAEEGVIAKDYRVRLLLVEGTDIDRGPLHHNAVRGVCLAVIDQGIALLRSGYQRDSALWIHRLAVRCQELEPAAERPAYAQRPRAKPGDETAEALLASVPGISTTSARALLEHFGSVAAIVNADRAEWLTVTGIAPLRARALEETFHLRRTTFASAGDR